MCPIFPVNCEPSEPLKRTEQQGYILTFLPSASLHRVLCIWWSGARRSRGAKRLRNWIIFSLTMTWWWQSDDMGQPAREWMVEDAEALERFMIPKGIITVTSEIPPSSSSVRNALSFVLPSSRAVPSTAAVLWGGGYFGVELLSFNSHLLLQDATASLIKF